VRILMLVSTIRSVSNQLARRQTESRGRRGLITRLEAMECHVTP